MTRFWRLVWRACFNLEIWAMDRWEKCAPEEVTAKEEALCDASLLLTKEKRSMTCDNDASWDAARWSDLERKVRAALHAPDYPAFVAAGGGFYGQAFAAFELLIAERKEHLQVPRFLEHAPLLARALSFLSDALEESALTEDEMHAEPGTIWVRLLCAKASLEEALALSRAPRSGADEGAVS